MKSNTVSVLKESNMKEEKRKHLLYESDQEMKI